MKKLLIVGDPIGTASMTALRKYRAEDIWVWEDDSRHIYAIKQVCARINVVTDLQPLIDVHMKFDVVIGNPPYNKGLSVKFINKAAELSDYVHFVLPKAIRKPSQLNRIDPYLHIIEDVDCAPGTFTGAGDIPAVVQKFEKRNYKREKIVTYTEHPDFVFVKKSENPDLMIGRSGCGPTGKVWTENFSHYREDHYYIRVNKPEVVDTLKSLTEDFKRVAKTARMMSLSKHEIISLYCEKTNTLPR